MTTSDTGGLRQPPITAHHGPPGPGLPGDPASFPALAEELITQAERELLCILSAGYMAADRCCRTLRLLYGAQQRGIQVKVLIPAPVSATSAAAVQAMGHQPGYRTRELPDQNLVIVDARQAAVRTPNRREEPAQTMIVSVLPLVHTLRTMFGLSWSSGVPLTEILTAQDKLRNEPTRSVLASLGAGEKDEMAARKLQVSVRTYRRHVAEIMRDIKAESRFQAGVRAAELGLFP